MKNLYKLIGIIVLGLFLNGCGTYYIASEYSDPIYDENYIPVDTINSEEELERKWRFDAEFRNDYHNYLVYQDYSFFSDMYWRNRMWRWGWTSSFDYYTNWQWHSYGSYAYWSPWNQYPGYGNWSSSYWYWHQWHNPWHYSYYYGPRTNYLGNVYGRRHSNRNSLVYSNFNRSSLFSVSDGRTSVGRTYLPNNNSNAIVNEINSRPTKPRPNSNNVIIRWRPSNNNSNNSNSSKPNNSSSRPILVKPTNTNTNTNWNSSRPNYNNNSRPSNNSNSRPSFNNNTSRPSAPTNNSKPNRSRRNPR